MVTSFSSGQEYKHCIWYDLTLGPYKNIQALIKKKKKHTGTNLTLGIYIHISTYTHIFLYFQPKPSTDVTDSAQDIGR